MSSKELVAEQSQPNRISLRREIHKSVIYYIW